MNKTTASALLVAGIGMGSSYAPEVEKIEYIEKPTIQIETVEVPVRFEGLDDTVDQALRDELKLKDDFTNKQLSDLVKEMADRNAALTKSNEKLLEAVTKSKSNVRKYYGNGGL